MCGWGKHSQTTWNRGPTFATIVSNSDTKMVNQHHNMHVGEELQGFNFNCYSFQHFFMRGGILSCNFKCALVRNAQFAQPLLKIAKKY